jgi:hypothetical protein
MFVFEGYLPFEVMHVPDALIRFWIHAFDHAHPSPFYIVVSGNTQTQNELITKSSSIHNCCTSFFPLIIR